MSKTDKLWGYQPHVSGSRMPRVPFESISISEKARLAVVTPIITKILEWRLSRFRVPVWNPRQSLFSKVVLNIQAPNSMVKPVNRSQKHFGIVDVEFVSIKAAPPIPILGLMSKFFEDFGAQPIIPNAVITTCGHDMRVRHRLDLFPCAICARTIVNKYPVGPSASLPQTFFNDVALVLNAQYRKDLHLAASKPVQRLKEIVEIGCNESR